MLPRVSSCFPPEASGSGLTPVYLKGNSQSSLLSSRAAVPATRPSPISGDACGPSIPEPPDHQGREMLSCAQNRKSSIVRGDTARTSHTCVSVLMAAQTHTCVKWNPFINKIPTYSYYASRRDMGYCAGVTCKFLLRKFFLC